VTSLEERHRRVGGVNVRYLIGGDGPNLVLCHGFLGSAENFALWFDELSRRRTLIVPDLPGCGATPPLPGRHTAAALARTVHALVDDLGIERFDLGGLCLGASVACGLVRLCDGRVDRLVLHTPLLAPPLINRRFRVQVRAMTTPGVFRAVHWVGTRRWVSDMYKRVMVEGDDVDPAAAEANFTNQLRADPRATRDWLRDGLARHDIEVITDRARPTLLLVPEHDSIANVAGLRAACANLAGVELAVIEDSGHGWTDDTVRRQLAVICAFLDAVPFPDGFAA